jgi:hypothetical protein
MTNIIQSISKQTSKPIISGHFTQIVWKNTKEIGIGKAGGIVVINYNPAGNKPCCVAANVFPPKTEQ